MSKTAQAWRATRRATARQTIVRAAWAVVREEGLAGLSLRHLAERAGTTTPTIYAYFTSKDDIYDAMFEDAAGDFEAQMSRPGLSGDARDALAESLRRFIAFCTEDVARYQLLFERSIPGFRPSPAAYAPAVRALETARTLLALNGIHDPPQLDVWTALTTGIVSQQIANDPGGDRWTRLVDEVVSMFLDHMHNRTLTRGAVS